MRVSASARTPRPRLNILFAAWLRMLSDVLRAKGISAKLRTLFSRPT
jgi:hypothetical protein